jgi:hypothetical protein
MRKTFMLTPVVLIASATIAFAQASGGSAGVGGAGAGGHAGGAAPSAHPAGVTGSAAPSGKSGTGTMPQSGQQPGCAGTATPSTSTTGIKPPC